MKQHRALAVAFVLLCMCLWRATAADGPSSQAQPQQTRLPHQGRCRLTHGRWCGLYLDQQPLPATLAPAHAKTCPGSCSGVGVCNALTGQCDCPAGWTGADCSQEQKRPCTDGTTKYRGPGTQPSSHIGPDKRDLNWTAGEWSASRCAGICDDNRGLCYCDGGRGVPPILDDTAAPPQHLPPGRPLSEYCQPHTTRDGQPAFGKTLYQDVYGSIYGWCNAAVGVEPAVPCGCPIDGQAGTWCELITEQVCPNSCSGHGRCDGGFCVCDQGWFGHDCAGRLAGQQPDEFNQSKALLERPWLAGHLVPPVAAAQPAPGATRKRPLVYVYDTPAWAAARMLQYRGTKQSCTWRFFGEGNATQLNTNWVYAAEPLLHEMLLASPHRTMDPEEADLFYVPAYVACYAWPVLGWADFPWWYSAGGPRVSHMAKMLLELKQHIQQTYPYWNRTDGRDHVWLAPHDEGACWIPTEIYQHSIILTHWGHMDADHTSNTAFAADNYSKPWVDTAHKGYENVSWTQLIQGHPCYTPGKDLVIPSPKFPPHYRWSPLLGASPQPRSTLLYFRGDVGTKRKPNYSRGIRQRLHALAQTPEWRDGFGVKIGTREEVPGDYSRGLASSKFCLVAPGDGWSGRLEDAVLHGCVPVIVQDGVHVSFESVLDLQAFSLRVPEQQLDNLPQRLLAVAPKELRRMQRNLRRVWHRFAYLSQPLLRDSALGTQRYWQQQQQQQSVGQAAASEPQQSRHLTWQPDGTWQLSSSNQATAPPHGRAWQLLRRLLSLPRRRLMQTQSDSAGPATTAGSGEVSDSSSSGGGGGSGRDSSSGGDRRGLGPLGLLLSRLQGLAAPRAVGSRVQEAKDDVGAGQVFHLTDQHMEDDAFGTVMQWLYARSLQLQRHKQHKQHVRHPSGGDGGQGAADAAGVG